MNNMKIALAAVSLPNRSLEDALAIARDQGYETICVFGATNMRHSGGVLPASFGTNSITATARS